MAEEVQIISTLDNTQTLKALTQTEKQVNSNAEALLDANAAAIKTMKTIVKESKAANKTLKELTESSAALTEEIENTQKGTARYKELRQELIQTNKEIKNVELSFEALDSEQVASEVGSVVGALADVGTGAFLAFGVAEESAAEFFKTIAQVEGAGRLVKGSIEGIQSATKLYNNVIKSGSLLQQVNAVSLGALGVAQKAYSAAVGTSTGGLKLFRLALIGTGIGALIVGIGLLIANFDEVQATLTDTSGAFAFIAVQIEDVKKGLQALGIIADAETERLQLLAQTQIENLKKEEAAIGERFDFEISKAQAAGKTTVALEKEKRKVVIASLKAQAEAIISLVRLTGELTDDQRKRLEEISKLAKKLSNETIVNEIKDTTERNKKAKEAREKREAEEIQAAKVQAENLSKIADELAQLRINAIGDEQTRELASLDNQFDARITKLKEGGEKEIELAVALEQEKNRKIDEVNEKAQLDREAKAKEQANLKKENEAALLEAEATIRESKANTELEKLEAEREAAKEAEQEEFEQKLVNLEERGILTQELEAEIEIARLASLGQINAEFDEARQLKEDELKQKEIDRDTQKRNAKILIASTTAGALGSISNSLDGLGIKSAGLSKTLAIADIALNTAKGVSAAIASGAAIPFPGNIPAIISGVASVLAGMVSAKKALSSAKIPGGGGGGSLTLPSFGGGGGGGGISIPTPTLPGGEGSGGNREADEQTAGSSQVVRAFVVEQDVTDEQANAKVIEEKSELT